MKLPSALSATLRRQIGRGGMGVVYEAWQGSLDRQVALKALPVGIAADDKAFHRFMREAKTTAKLSHANIVGVHGVGIEQNTPYNAMEFVEGETLAQILARIKDADPETDTPFGAKDEVAYFGNLAKAFAEVADGLQHAHSKGVVHRDIKPSNLILDDEGKLRILDFGLARLEGQESLTLSGDLMGTVLYMSPEQAMAKRIPLDHRTDVYSLGVTMYEMLTGQPPFRGKDQHDTLSQIIVRDPRPPRQLNPRVPKDLETIVLKCLRKDPGGRFGTAEALAQDLRRFVRGDAIEATPEAVFERLRRAFLRSRRRIAIGVLMFLLTLTAALLAINWHERRVAARNSEYDTIVERATEDLGYWRYRAKLAGGRIAGRQLMNMRSENEAKARIENALRELDHAIEMFPRRPAARYLKARGRALRGETDQSREELVEIAKKTPNFLPALLLRAELAIETGDDSAVERVVAKAESSGAKWVPLWLAGRKAMANGHWAEAAGVYAEILESDEHDLFPGTRFDLAMGRGIALFESGEAERAKQVLLRAHFNWPRAILPVVLLGVVYFDEGHLDLAQDLCESFYAQARHKTEAASVFSGVFQTDYFGNGEEVLRWVLRLPRTPERERRRMNLLKRLGQTKRAIEIGEKQISEGLRDPALLATLANAYADLGDNERAVRLVDEALLERKGSAKVLFESFWPLMTMKDFTRAEEVIRQLLSEDPDFYWAPSNLGWVLLRQRRITEAIEHFQGVLRKNPLEVGAERFLAGIYRQIGDHSTALSHAIRAAAQDPWSPRASNELGRIHEAMGDVRQAEREFMRTLRPTPGGGHPRTEAWLSLARLSRKRGDFIESLDQYVHGLESRPLWRGQIQRVIGNVRKLVDSDPALSGRAEFDRIVDVLETFLEENDEFPDVLRELAFALEHSATRKDPVRARRYLDRARDLEAKGE